MKTKKHTYGWVPDAPDHRDFLYREIQPLIKLPQAIDLRTQCTPVEDQGQLGSCTANALAGNLEFLDNLDKKYSDVSRLFIYYNERLMRGMEDSDSGAALRDGIKTLNKDGVCEETSWPYVIERFAQKPSAICYKQAQQRKIVTYHRLQTLNEMLTCLSDGFPFVFGFSVYESFESQIVAKTGKVPMPARSEQFLGGHAVMAVGFNQKEKHFIIRNSWGSNWGINGYCTMPYQYLETLARDFWTIRK